MSSWGLSSVYMQMRGLSSLASIFSRSYRSASSAEPPFALKNYGYWVKGNPGIKVGDGIH